MSYEASSNKEFISIERIAKERNISMAQVSLAWVLNRPGVYWHPTWRSFTRHLTISAGVSASIVGTTSLQSFSDLIGNVIHVFTVRP